MEDIAVDTMKLTIPDTTLIAHLLGSESLKKLRDARDAIKKNQGISPFSYQNLQELATSIANIVPIQEATLESLYLALDQVVSQNNSDSDEWKDLKERYEEQGEILKALLERASDMQSAALQVSPIVLYTLNILRYSIVRAIRHCHIPSQDT